MKSSRMTWMVAAAVLTVAAGSASAQAFKAEIPLTFRAGQTTMAPGSYDIDLVTRPTGVTLVRIYNLTAGKSIFLMPLPGIDAPAAWAKAGKPVLSFECVGDACALAALWGGRGVDTYHFQKVGMPRGETHAALVVMRPANAD